MENQVEQQTGLKAVLWNLGCTAHNLLCQLAASNEE